MYGEIGNKLVQHAKRTQSLAHLPPYQTELVRAVTREVRDLDRDVEQILAPFKTRGEDDDDDDGDYDNGAGRPSAFDPSADPATACYLLVDHLCMRRNKRCLLAYHRVRADKLEEMCWSGTDVLEQQAELLLQQQQQQLQQQQQQHAAAGRRGGGSGEEEAESGGGGGVGGSGMGAEAGGNTSSLSPEEEEYVRQFGDLLAAYKGRWTDVDLTGSLEPPRDLFIDVRVLRDAGEIQTEYGAITLTKNSQFYVRQGDVERLIAQGYLQKLS
ncbi:MAG: DNA replication protein psf1 [Sclerophora amabilis]|nr:MAG: DNA replication protein psf1 [Sclerophora amabilis]